MASGEATGQMNGGGVSVCCFSMPNSQLLSMTPMKRILMVGVGSIGGAGTWDRNPASWKPTAGLQAEFRILVAKCQDLPIPSFPPPPAGHPPPSPPTTPPTTKAYSWPRLAPVMFGQQTILAFSGQGNMAGSGERCWLAPSKGTHPNLLFDQLKKLPGFSGLM